MAFTYHDDIPWTEHFVQYGFAVRRGLVSKTFCDTAVARIRERLNLGDLPLNEWTADNAPTLHQPFYEGGTQPDPVLEQVYDEPGVKAAITEMFGSEDRWDLQRNYYLFVKPFEPKGKAVITQRGHIDFAKPPAPPLYNGFAFQVALTDTEPFGGNLTVHPGGHITMQRSVLDDPMANKSGVVDIPLEEPWEFVANAGDVIFVHHLMPHSGNASHAAGRSPRVCLFCEAFSHQWQQAIDPADENLSPWERSQAHNGPIQTDPAVERIVAEHRRSYIRDLRAKEQSAAPASP